jgi:hypothetical protein
MISAFLRRAILLGALAMGVACSQEADNGSAPSASEQAMAAELLKSFETARKEKNWEVAESYADQLRTKYPDSEAAANLAPQLDAVRVGAEAAREQRRLRELWDYQAVPRGKGEQRTATIYSRTAEVGEGEPAITPDAQLVLRDHPEWGRSAYLLLAQSRFRCGPPCTMTIAFDDAPAVSYAGKQADSGKGPALFIEDDERFVAAMTAAKRVRIQLPKGSGSASSLTFEVGGFDAARYAKP